MWSVFGWVLIGFAIWALMLVMHVVQKRYAPEWNDSPGQASQRPFRRSKARGFWGSMWDWGDTDEASISDSETQALEQEIHELKERVKVLETIVTDRRWQYDEELHRQQ